MSRTAGTDRFLGGLAVAGLLAAALAAPAATAAPAPSTAYRAVTPDRIVVAISVDGLNPDAIRELGPELAPSYHRLLAEGAGTLNARSAVERTVTLPNHTGMLTGRRVRGVAGHHIGFNNDDKGTTVHTEAGGYRASLFDVVHNRGGSTALYTTKDKFALFDRSWGSNGNPDRVGKDHGTDKIDEFVVGSAEGITGRVVEQLTTGPLDATFLHLGTPDEVGHDFGFMGPEYLAAVAETDRLVGQVLDAVRSTRYLRRHVTVVLTADHGGRGGGHSDPTDPDNYTVPFFAWGVGVARGAELYALNQERVDPGTLRPRYRTNPPIRNTDLASLVTTLLGHRAVPGGLLPGTEPLRVG